MTDIKLLVFKLFNIIYVNAYTPFWVKDTDTNGTTESITCTGNGVQIINGQLVVCTPQSSGQSATGRINSTLDSIKFIMNLITGLGVIICVFSLTYSAIQFALSNGNQQKKTKAMDRLKLSLIGLAAFGGIGTVVNVIFNLVG